MAKLTKAQQLIASYKQVIKTKTAELDMVDDQLMALDSTLPVGTTNDKFDLLAEKREELEVEIRKSRERIQLITEWEKLKSGDWSEEVKAELKNLDQNFASIADGASGDMGMMGDPMMGGGIDPMGMPPVAPAPAPVAPAAPAPAVDAAPAPAPEVPPAPAPESTEPAPDAAAPEASAPEAAPEEAPIPAIASAKSAQASAKNNYQPQDKKGSAPSTSTKGDTHMANQNSKPSLKEKLAEAKSKREAIVKEAKTRVAASWTIAKTMLPNAPAEVQKAFAANLLQNSTKMLTAALRQTAINAHYTKQAETAKQVKAEVLNDPKLMEEPSALKSEQAAVRAEIKGDPKNAAAKTADDRSECGEQPKTYDDGRHGSEPKEIDASKANDRKEPGDRPGDTINLSEGKSASKKTASCDVCKESVCKCKKAAGEEVKTAGPEDAMPPAPEAAPAPAPEAPVEGGDVPPADVPEVPAGNPEDAAGEIMTDEKKMVIEEKIEEAQEAIRSLEAEILEESEEDLDVAGIVGEGDEVEGEGEELNLDGVFDEGQMEDKVSSLANEGDKMAGEEDYFAPTSAQELEASFDDSGMHEFASIFSMQGADGDPLASLMETKTAAEVAGMTVVPSGTGEAAKKFKNEETGEDDRDVDTDHAGLIWAEAIDAIGEPEDSGQKRVPQDAKPQLEAPKKATLRQIKNVQASNETSLGEVFLGSFFGDEE